MPSLNRFIYSAAQYNIIISIAGIAPFKLQTSDSVEYEIKKEDELIYAISYEDAIGAKTNAKTLTGKISLQAGELNALLIAAGLSDATEIAGITLAIASYDGLFSRVFGNVNIFSESFSVRAKDKASLINCDWHGLIVQSIG